MALTADIQQQVFDLLSRASNISFITAEQEAGSITTLAPGQRISAEVLSTLPNNRAQVRVGNERFNLDLPMSVRTGQTLEMTFVSSAPRSTFAIARTVGVAPPVSISDASRLLSLLVSKEQTIDSQFRSSLQGIGDMLRSSSGEAAVLANLLDEAVVYGSGRESTVLTTDKTAKQSGGQAAAGQLTPAQALLTAFESNAAQILKNIAQSSRFTLVQATGHPVTPLPLVPGEEVNATIIGTMPGGKTFVEVAGTTLELLLPQKGIPGEILRLTYLSAEPKPTFALARSISEGGAPALSEAGRWLSVLEHSQGGISSQQTYVLDRLSSVLKSLPPDSPAFSVISDEALTYQRNTRPTPATDPSVAVSAAGPMAPQVMSGNGIVLSDDMAKLLQAVIKGNRLALLEALNQQAAPGSFMPGQQLRGEVLATLGGGRFTVQVAGQMLEFILPKGVRRGDLINLFFISEEPRQTFLMVRFGQPGDSKVSDTGRWLSGFLGETSGQLPAQATMGLLRTLLAGPPTDASLLGQLLQQALSESGLFYESHLSRWFGGEYRLEDLLREPQGGLSPRLVQTGAKTAALTDELVRASIRSGSADVMEELFKKAGSRMGHEGLADPRSITVVSDQLSVLQHGQLLFRGDLFPGQSMEWSVAEREAEHDQSNGREKGWETSVSINLPNLGPVTAQLTLNGQHVSIKVTVEESTTVTVLEDGRSRLIEQLEGAGLAPADMTITHAVA